MISKIKSLVGRATAGYKNSMKIITVILLIICGVLGYQSVKSHQEIKAYEQAQEELRDQITQEEEEQKAIKEKSEYLNSDQYIEDLAREKLGLIFENELIFKKQ